ncbi:MAG: Ig-like domain-containing protein [Gemmatimonadales bacterium]
MSTRRSRCAQAIALALLSTLGWLGGCSDSPGGPCSECAVEGLIVSDPVPTGSLVASTGASLALASSAEDEVVYVSLLPGTVPTGSRAAIRRIGDTVALTTAVLDGGFDPVPVEAQTGDSIEVVVTDAGGGTLYQERVVVTAARPPIVVRTNPPRRKTDVPLNAALVIVFSEPVDGGTLTSSSVQLFRGTTAVAGAVRLLQGSGAAAAFIPAAPLDPNTDYRLVVTAAVRDLEGDALEAGVTVEFTTGQSSTGPAASIMLSPDTVSITEGATYQMTATVRDAAGNMLITQPLAWSSNDSSALTVSSTGLVTALAPGFYIVTATLNGLTGFARVVVTTGTPASVVLSPTPASVGAGGDTIILSATVRDARGRLIRYPSLTWSSSAPTVATVAPYDPGDGRVGLAAVTGVSQGSATITATTGTASGTASVTVTAAVPVASVTVAPGSASVLLRYTRQLSATVRDANGRILLGRPITWTSDNTAAVTVSVSGLVTAVGAGTAAVIATSEEVSDTAAITGVVLKLGSMTAGSFHSCGITTSGAAYCWGWNQDGQLGDGSEFSRLIPVAVTGGVTFSVLSATFFHTCGVTTSGAAYCWGDNLYGRLGIGIDSPDDSRVPAAVTGGLAFAVVSTGDAHTCGVTTSGAAYCWGRNYEGQLGVGVTTGPESCSTRGGTPSVLACSTVPVLVAGGLTLSSVSTGRTHSCGLTISGAAYCWGDNGSGQLGNGTTTSSAMPVAVSGELTFAAVSAGGTHTCGVTTGGAAYCWGWNADGQLGDGTATDRLTPAAVSGGLGFLALAGGRWHTCGVATTGAAYCWGYNRYGQLGDGSYISTSIPMAVTGGLTFSAVVPGTDHTCALATTGTAYCWGYNAFAELGDGTTTSTNVPIKVAGQP